MLDRLSEVTILACLAWVVTWALHGQPHVVAGNAWFWSLVTIVVAAVACQFGQDRKDR